MQKEPEEGFRSKGPEEGFRAAKDKALAINPNLRCKRMHYGTDENFHILDGAKVVGRGRLARDAWNDFIFHLRK